MSHDVLNQRNNARNNFLTIMFTVIFFSNAVLRSEENLNIYIMISIGIFVITMLRTIRRPLNFKRTFFSYINIWLLLLFSMYFFYGLILEKYSYFNTRYFMFIMLITLSALLLLVDVEWKSIADIFIKGCIIASVSICAFIVLNEWTMLIGGGTRIGETGSGNVNTLASYLGIMSVSSIFMVIFHKKYIYLTIYMLNVILMLLTGSKQALLYIVFGSLILVILKNKFKIHKYLTLLFFLSILVYVIFNNEFLYNIVGHRIIDFAGTLGLNMESASKSHSTIKRIFMIKSGFNAFMENPLFGGGWSFFSVYSGLGTYSHNNYIEIIVTYGVFGFMLYYGMIFKLYVKLRNILNKSDEAKLFFTIIVLMLIGDIVAVNFTINIIYYQVIVFSYLFMSKYDMTKNRVDANKEREENYA